MKAILLYAALFVSPVLAAERTLSVTDFDRLRVDGSFTVEVTTGRGASARISGSQAAIEATNVAVQGRQMTIRKNQSAWGGYPGREPTQAIVRITAPALANVLVSGPAKVTIDRLKGPRVAASLQGAGELVVNSVVADRTDLVSLGSGTLRIAGTTADLVATVRGSGNFDAGALIAADARLISESAGTVTIAVRRAANVTMTGTGTVTVLGKPACTVRNIGSGIVACGRSNQP